MRKAETTRKTKETEIRLMIDLDGRGECAVGCPEPFLGHMLDAFCRFSLIDVAGNISGDLSVDPHHTVEDSGFVLGTVLREALGAMAGVMRAGSAYFPMDEALVRVVIDFSGRPYCLVDGCEAIGAAGAFTRELFEEFWQGFCRGARATMHIDLIRGKNGHHVYEAGYKAAGRAVMAAISVMSRAAGIIPSTKGALDGYPRGASAGNIASFATPNGAASAGSAAPFATPNGAASAGNAASFATDRAAVPKGKGSFGEAESTATPNGAASAGNAASFATPNGAASAGNAASGYAGRNAIPEGNGA